MNKYIKYIVLVILISAIISYLSFFRTEVTLDGGVEYAGEIVSSDISIEEDYISISSFAEPIIENHWIAENEVVLKAKHESEGLSNYKFNSVDINLEKLDVDLESLTIEGVTYDVVYRLRAYDLILSKANDDYTDLYIFKQEKLSRIGTLKNMDKKPLIVSKNFSKVLYLDKDSQINTYSILNSKRRSSIVKFESDSSLDFFKQFSISNDGGFFSYSLLSDNFSESSFSIYGADSGKLYAKDIIGVTPKFSTLSNKVAFFYSGDVTSNILSKSRVGVLNLKSKKIIYYDRTDEGEIYFGNPRWTKDNEKVIFTSTINDENYINILDITKMVKLKYSVLLVELDNNLQVIGNKVYWTTKDKGEEKLSILGTTGKSPIYVEKLRMINESDENYIISSGDDVYVIQGNYLLIVSGEVIKQVAYIDEYSRVLSISSGGEHMLVEKNVDGNIEIKVYTIK
ncbi:MAG: hypothetical protein WBA54_14815 [Acidaminobacteraceae bacterium]